MIVFYYNNLLVVSFVLKIDIGRKNYNKLLNFYLNYNFYFSFVTNISK